MKSRTRLGIIILLLCLVCVLGFTQTNLFQKPENPKPFQVQNQLSLKLTSILPAPLPLEEIVKHNYYTLSYNNQYELANWVAYTLKPWMISGNSKRKNDFRQDPLLHCGSAKTTDYDASHLDKGHLLPAGDMSFSDLAISETFFMSNMCPQKPGFNRGIWKKLEDQVRRWALLYNELQICSGPIIDKKNKTIGMDHVAIPTYFFKVILDVQAPEIKGIGFIMPNESSDMPIEKYAVSIDSVEHFTGINFFDAMPDSLENILESKMNLHDWNFDHYEHKKKSQQQDHLLESIQCKGYTKKGDRCKKMTKYTNGFCGQHGGN